MWTAVQSPVTRGGIVYEVLSKYFGIVDLPVNTQNDANSYFYNRIRVLLSRNSNSFLSQHQDNAKMMKIHSVFVRRNAVFCAL